jgi:hypothetical protein
METLALAPQTKSLITATLRSAKTGMIGNTDRTNVAGRTAERGDDLVVAREAELADGLLRLELVQLWSPRSRISANQSKPCLRGNLTRWRSP